MSKTIHLKLKKGETKIKLRQTWLNTYSSSEIRVLRCFVAWSLRNIRKDLNDKISIDGTDTVIPPGYYNFSELQELLKTHKVTISRLKNNHVTLSFEKDLNLKTFGELLGFTKDKAITKSTDYTSTFSASLTNKLKDIHVHCSLVNPDKNLSYDASGTSYYQSDWMLVLSIDTTQPLNGNITNFPTELMRLPVRDYTGQEISFRVESGGHPEDYEIYLTIEII